ncbi:hypothetical protein ACFC09_15665 [Streptomyces sp. NPDC056161]|uniref:hypothetical protein n=1 Tax=Streptomyces sp. NPDC056161 TaxID=3345732 RepID=UPI0035DEA55D
MPRYFASPDGSAVAMAADGPIAAASLPEGWAEITAEAYATKQEEHRQAADAQAAEFIANDGEIPNGGADQAHGLPLAEVGTLLG